MSLFNSLEINELWKIFKFLYFSKKISLNDISYLSNIISKLNIIEQNQEFFEFFSLLFIDSIRYNFNFYEYFLSYKILIHYYLYFDSKDSLNHIIEYFSLHHDLSNECQYILDLLDQNNDIIFEKLINLIIELYTLKEKNISIFFMEYDHHYSDLSSYIYCNLNDSLYFRIYYDSQMTFSFLLDLIVKEFSISKQSLQYDYQEDKIIETDEEISLSTTGPEKINLPFSPSKYFYSKNIYQYIRPKLLKEDNDTVFQLYLHFPTDPFFIELFNNEINKFLLLINNNNNNLFNYIIFFLRKFEPNDLNTFIENNGFSFLIQKITLN